MNREGRIVRRELLRSLLGAGGDRPAEPGSFVPRTPSPVPFTYVLKNLVQDGTGAWDTISNGFWAPQGPRYRVKFIWTPTQGAASGRLSFRLQDYSNYYSLNFYPTQIGFSKTVKNVTTDIQRVYRPIDTTHPATFALQLDNSTFSVIDTSAPGQPVIMKWTDPISTYPTGVAISHATDANRIAVWNSVTGFPN
jgi:hypothetical protein